MKSSSRPSLWCVCGAIGIAGVAMAGDARMGDARPIGYRFFPVDRSSTFPRTTASATAGNANKRVYSNTEGHIAVELPADTLVADDITPSVGAGCPLTRYTFQITGKANPLACGGTGQSCGPLRVDFALYSECPSASGTAIVGTVGCAATVPMDGCVLLANADALAEIEFIPTAPIELPSMVWLGVSMSRANAGVIVGAPALAGFSADLLDAPGAACRSTFGGFPSAPHASFNAALYADASCADAHLTYQNRAPANSGINAGSGTCIAEDIQLLRTCDMVELEVGVRGLGRYDFELRHATPLGEPVGFCNSFDSLGTNAIPGTRFVFVNQSGGLKVFRKSFDPPIPLPDLNLFAVMLVGNVNAKWVLTRQDAAVGSTANTYYTFAGSAAGGTWTLTSQPNGTHAGFHLTITCAGAAPVGACCDQYLRDDANEAVCRDVPEINCAFPPRNSSLRPAWEEGISCRVCEGGSRDTAGCDGDAACPGGTCVGNDPFVLPCGVAACCTPDGGCENLTANQCDRLLPACDVRTYEVGQLCASQGQRCPVPACANAEGDCLLPHPSVCNGGINDGLGCNGSDGNCPGTPGGPGDGTCPLLPESLCFGGDRDGLVCTTDLDCIPGGFCTRRLCQGGARDGIACEFERDCKEAFCERFVGCDDPFCCTNVCQSSPGGPFGSEFCCQVEWDQACANIAQTHCGTLTRNDACAPSDYRTGAAEIVVNGLAVSTSGFGATDEPGEGICCNGGQRRCIGGCDDGAVCDNRFDCRGADPGFCNLFSGLANAACVGGCNSNMQCVFPDIPSEVRCVGGSNDGSPCAPRCAGGSRDGNPCAETTDCPGFATCDFTADCPGGTCDNSFCDGIEDGICGDYVPEPGTPGVGSVWYFFTVPDGVGDTLDVEVSTCGSSSPARDSMVQVYAVADVVSDSGVCDGLGRLFDGTPCHTEGGSCGQNASCQTTSVACSVSRLDCPLGAACVPDRSLACDNLQLVGCNDDAPDGCGDPIQAHNSRLCLPNLQRGRTYYVLVSAKSEATRGNYRVTVRSTDSCAAALSGTCINAACSGGMFSGASCMDDADCNGTAPPNDFCPFAEDLVDADGDHAITLPFDLDGATADCLAPSCLGNLQNDVWFRYTAPTSGLLLASTCGDTNETTPDTELIIYDGCDCGAGLVFQAELGKELCCSSTGDPYTCLGGSDCDIRVVAGNCYLMRLGDNGGRGARGELNITLISNPVCPTGTVTWIDPRSGTIDARVAEDCAFGGGPLGIDTFTVTAPPGANPAVCWSLCEASTEGLNPNGIASVVEAPFGAYTITLARPITPGSCTTITYDPAHTNGVPRTAKFSFLPGDVNGDGTTSPGDILDLIDILNGISEAAWGMYSTDISGDGRTGPGDILYLIDLLNGAACYNVWNGVSIGTVTTCGTCPAATP